MTPSYSIMWSCKAAEKGDFYELANFAIPSKEQSLSVANQDWRIVKSELVPDSCVYRIEIERKVGSTQVKKVIRFDRETGHFSVYQPEKI